LPAIAQVPEGPFRAYRAGAAGGEFEFLEAGVGDPLLVLGGSGGPGLTLLAATRRVIALDLPAAGHAREQAAAAGTAVAALGLGPVDLLADAAGAEAALWRAADAPELVRSLVLESPAAPGPELAAALPGVGVPALVLCGTRSGDAGPDGPGVAFQRLLPGAFLSFIYAAGRDIRGDRPEAFAALVSDFLTRQGRFLAHDGAGGAP
jgi:pimeloyl-ACP methyl ester carboxylesterase